jgi:hypothetical protein
MNLRTALPAAAAVVLISLPSAALAASSASSTASNSASSATSSASDSLGGSSNASSPNNRAALDGEYRVAGMQGVAGRPDRVQLQLVPVQGDAARAFTLVLPQAVAEQHAVGLGVVVRAKAREYGVEFALAATQVPFFLVIEDAVHDELASRKVSS